MENCTPLTGASQPLRASFRTTRGSFGQLPEHVVDTLCDLILWGTYAYLDLRAGRSGWVKATASDLASRTDRSAGTFGTRSGELERAGLILVEPAGRARIYRTARRRGERFGRLPDSLVAATGSAELWGLYAWLGLLAGGARSLRMSYQEIAADLGLARARVNRLLLDLEALNAIALRGHGDSRLIDLAPDVPACTCASSACEAAVGALEGHIRMLPDLDAAESQAGDQAPQIGSVLTADWSRNERGSQRAPTSLLNSGSHNNPLSPHHDQHHSGAPDGDREQLAACLEAWKEVIGPVPELVRVRIERYVRSGSGDDLKKAIGWCVGRQVRSWRYVEEVLRTRGWETPPPPAGRRGLTGTQSGKQPGRDSAIDALTLTQ